MPTFQRTDPVTGFATNSLALSPMPRMAPSLERRGS